jgi:hypothetical protein
MCNPTEGFDLETDRIAEIERALAVGCGAFTEELQSELAALKARRAPSQTAELERERAVGPAPVVQETCAGIIKICPICDRGIISIDDTNVTISDIVFHRACSRFARYL